MSLTVKTPTMFGLGDTYGQYLEKRIWLEERGLQIITQSEALNLLRPGLMQSGEWGLRIAEELPRHFSHGVYQTHTVDVMTFIPDYHIWTFPPWAGDEAMLFKLTFAGM